MGRNWGGEGNTTAPALIALYQAASYRACVCARTFDKQGGNSGIAPARTLEPVLGGSKLGTIRLRRLQMKRRAKERVMTPVTERASRVKRRRVSSPASAKGVCPLCGQSRFAVLEVHRFEEPAKMGNARLSPVSNWRSPVYESVSSPEAVYRLPKSMAGETLHMRGWSARPMINTRRRE